jgi:nucleoside phosphorylase
MIICAGNQEVFDFATTIGIGLVDSSYGLTKLCIESKPDKLIFIGSAGSYGKYKLFDIVTSKSSTNIELGYYNNHCYSPIQNIQTSLNSIVKDETIVNSSNYITTNEDISNNFLKDSIGIENMEFYALVSVAKKFDIPIAGIFIITNYTNKDAHKEFLSNHTLAMSKLVKYLKQNKII